MTYVMTVDLDHEVPPDAWPYAEEEYPVTCFLDAGTLFDHEPIGDHTIVLHRFGGSYGPAVFRLDARHAGSGTMRLTLADRAGLPVAVISLDEIEIREASASIVEAVEPIADLEGHLQGGSRAEAALQPIDQTMPPGVQVKGFRWLHLSDLKCGEKRRGSHTYLVSLMLHDLGQLIRRDGSIDALFVTGDLSFTGTSQETSEAVEILSALQRGIGGVQGSRPVILSVPGNHDLDMRITPDYERWVRRWHRDAGLRSRFFSAKSRFRNLVLEGFGTYAKWLSRCMPRDESRMISGLLPGDFSCSFERAGARIGVIGLNDSFLHSFGGEHVGLEICLEQLEAICKRTDAWAATHDIRILLTHHDPDLLHERARIRFDTEIAPPGRFQLHLYGGLHRGGPHFTHESELRKGASLRCQARPFAEPSHSVPGGYTVGEIQPMVPAYDIQIWPRMCIPRVVPDQMVLLDQQESARFVLARPELLGGSETTSWYVKRAVDDQALRQLSRGKWVYVHGPRRSGRTSLLQHLARRLHRDRKIDVKCVAPLDFEERSAMKLLERLRAAQEAIFVDDIDQIVGEPSLRAVLVDLESLRNQKVVCLAGLRPIESLPVAVATIPIEDFTRLEMNGFRDRSDESPAERIAMLEQVHTLSGGEASMTWFLVDALRQHPGDPSMSAGELIEHAIEEASAAGEAPERIDLRDAAALRIYASILRAGKVPSAKPASAAELMLLDSGLVRMAPGPEPALLARSQLHRRMYDQAWVDARLMELEASEQTLTRARKSEPGKALVLLLDLAENPIDEATVFTQFSEGVKQSIVLRLTDFGVARHGTGTPDDWLPVLSAIDRMLEAAHAQEMHGPWQYWIAGRAGLPAFFYLGHRLAKFAPVTLVHLPSTGIVDVLPLGLSSPPVEVPRPYFTRSPWPTRPQRSQTWLGLVVSSMIRIRKEQVEELMFESDMAPAEVIEAHAIDRLDERSVMAASIELDECMGSLSVWYPQHEGLAVFIAGPTTLAFLVGRAIHPLVFPHVQVFQYQGERYTLAYDTGLLRPESADTPVSAEPKESASSRWASWEFGSEDVTDEVLDAIRDELIQAVHGGGYPVGYTEIEELMFRNIDEEAGVAEIRASFSAEHHREDFEFDGHVDGYIEFDAEAKVKQELLDSVKVTHAEAHFDMGDMEANASSNADIQTTRTAVTTASMAGAQLVARPRMAQSEMESPWHAVFEAATQVQHHHLRALLLEAAEQGSGGNLGWVAVVAAGLADALRIHYTRTYRIARGSDAPRLERVLPATISVPASNLFPGVTDLWSEPVLADDKYGEAAVARLGFSVEELSTFDQAAQFILGLADAQDRGTEVSQLPPPPPEILAQGLCALAAKLKILEETEPAIVQSLVELVAGADARR